METKLIRTITDDELIAELFLRFMPDRDDEMRVSVRDGGTLRATTMMVEVRRDPSKMVIDRT